MKNKMSSKNQSKEFKVCQRASLDSDTSGYSSASICSRKSEGSIFNDHDYSILAPNQNHLYRKSCAVKFNKKYNDKVVSLKEEPKQSPVIVQAIPHLQISEIDVAVKSEDSSRFSPIKTRRKSLALEQDELNKNALRRSRRLSSYVEVIKEETPKHSIRVRRKSTAGLVKELLQFPKIKDKIVELKSSSPSSNKTISIVNRRKSHGDIDNMTCFDRKVINRRRSVYVAPHNDSSSIAKKRPRRQSTYQEPIKKSRRKSVCKEISKRNKVKRTVKKSCAIQQEDTQHIEEEVIEDIWFVSVVTIEKESQMRFLVKWDGHPPSENTYEPFEHIRHCDVLQEYVDRKFNQHSEEIEKISNQFLSDVQEKFKSYLNRSKQSIVKKFCDFNELEFKSSLLAFIFTYGGEVLMPYMKKLRYDNLIYHFYAKWKKEQESNFMLVETIMSEENYSFKLTAENNIDYEPIPKFKYLAKVNYPMTSYSFGLNVGCKCGSLCNKNTNCCPQNRGWNFVYNEADLKLNTKEIQMIVECNDFCSCDKNCPNRPKEIIVNLVIFKSIDKGWSVKTLDHIPAGKFIVEYTGEFLNEVESKRRAKAYNNDKATYLFDLDYIEKGTPYSIDASHKGNIARFINHSCNPNLSTWPATTCNQDPRFHKLYYFSHRYIRPGEELTVDYTGGRNRAAAPKENMEMFKCHCKSSVCRGYIF